MDHAMVELVATVVGLLLIAATTLAVTKRLRLPFTVALVLVGMLLTQLGEQHTYQHQSNRKGKSQPFGNGQCGGCNQQQSHYRSNQLDHGVIHLCVSRAPVLSVGCFSKRGLMASL